MQKFTSNDVKSFEFSDLKGDHVISQAKFEGFSFQTIEGKPFKSERPDEETIRQERSFEKKNEFRMDETVRELRGLSRQEQNDVEERIQREVENRLKLAFEDAYKEGLEKGLAEGQTNASKATQDSVNRKMGELEELVAQVQQQSKRLTDNNQSEIYEFVKRFTKWIILKEVNEQKYLGALLEKLLLELNARKNLIIKVGKANFSQMPEVIEAVEAKLGQLSNVRVEIVPEINHPGIILESENGLIDGSLEGVFANIDQIFDRVNSDE